MNIDWSKAPEGATHRVIGGCWYKVEGDSVQFFNGYGKWSARSPLSDYSDCWDDLIARPVEWSGEGLPPVGAMCEWKEKTGFSWVQATVLFITDSSVVMQREDGFEWQMMTARTVFRPLRTPGEIAAEEREGAIHEMVDHLKRWHTVQDLCGDLYDAGYRKQVKPC